MALTYKRIGLAVLCLGALAVIHLTFDASYVRLLAVTAMAGLTAAASAWVIANSGKVWLFAGVLFILLLLLLDPYSFGSVGGDQNLQTDYAWQRWATGAMVVLVVVSLVYLRRSQYLASMWLLIAESVLLLAANAVYLQRDGFETRSLQGYESWPLPLVVTALGLAVRGLVIAALVRTTRRVQASVG